MKNHATRYCSNIIFEVEGERITIDLFAKDGLNMRLTPEEMAKSKA